MANRHSLLRRTARRAQAFGPAGAWPRRHADRAL